MELLRGSSKVLIVEKEGSFNVVFNEKTIFKHTEKKPMLYIGLGEESIDMHCGNYDIRDYVIQRTPLGSFTINQVKDEIKISFAATEKTDVSLEITLSLDEAGRLRVKFDSKDSQINRSWIRIKADMDEKVYGCGEQPSHFNMRGKNFPLWSSEPGVGRNKKTYTTFLADVTSKSGGDYYTTYYPEQTFISSNKYYCHVDSYAYADFDFRHPEFFELQIWEVPKEMIFGTADTFVELIEKLTDLLGRQQELPEWVYNGVILGIQGGTEYVSKIIKKMKGRGVEMAGVFCQDWEGIRNTSFGKRLFWDWKWNKDVYPQLDQKLIEWKKEDIRFMGYINPYVCSDGLLFEEATEKNYLALNDEGEIYLVDFGEFYCGIVDFTYPEAYEWYKGVIKKNMIELGLDGWMADFGEYLPTDIKLYDNSDPMIMHNKWPALWAKVNYDALEESGKLGEILYFMRAGATGSQKYCTLMWAGDQSVDWSLDDGLASVIPSTLSLAMTGCGINHSDIGGYTSLYGNVRTKELFMRWAEMAAFSPVMRTHEGNRPIENFQVFNDEEATDHLAKFTKIYVQLKDYMKKLVKENARKGIPVQRPLFMHYESDLNCYEIQYEYLLGRDLLVAPVYQEGKGEWELYLPEDDWVHLWTKKEYKGGVHVVSAPIGQPPVFYRKDSDYFELFSSIS